MTTYERIPGDDSESCQCEQITERNDEPERPLDAYQRHFASLQKESQQDSEVPTGRGSRVRRSPKRLGIDEVINKMNNEDRLQA